MRNALVNSQEKEGSMAGSWAPRGEHASTGSQVVHDFPGCLYSGSLLSALADLPADRFGMRTCNRQDNNGEVQRSRRAAFSPPATEYQRGLKFSLQDRILADGVC